MRACSGVGKSFRRAGRAPRRWPHVRRGRRETHAAVAVIAHSVWTREFSADPSVIGRSIRVADEFVQIVGVAPALFDGIDRVRPGGRAPDVWLPMWLADRVLPLSAAEQRRQDRDLAFVGRLKDGVEVPELQAEAEVVAVRLAASEGRRHQGRMADVRRVWRVRPESWHLGRHRRDADPDPGPRDRVRERREPDAGARIAAAARDGHPSGHRRGTRAGSFVNC